MPIRKGEDEPLLAVRVDKSSPHPVYLQIAERIRAVLAAAALPAGTPLPSERVLCLQYGVSRMTLRQAFDLLERDGLIDSQRGRGKFVAHRRMAKQQQEMHSFTEEMLSRGATPSSRLLSFRVLEAGPAAGEFFGLPETQTVYAIQRVRCGNGEPLALESIEVPCYLCPNLERFDLANQSLYRILEENYGLELTHCVEEISAARPDRKHKKLLGVPQSAAVLVIKRKTFAANETPVEMGTTIYRGDAYTAVVRSIRRTEGRF
jgi:GntR family transcriptional regulator